MANPARVLIVPGSSVVLERVARKLAARPDVSMMNTANALLWSLRREPATHVLAATDLPEFDSPTLVDVVHAIDPAIHLLLCGPSNPDLVSLTRQPHVELVSSVNDLMRWVERLDLDRAGVETPPAPPARSFRRAPSGSAVIDAPMMTTIERALEGVVAETGAVAAILSDLAGMTIAQHGQMPPDAAPLFAPLLGTLFSTGAELGTVVGEPYAERLYVHSGVRHQVYAVAVGERWILSAVRVTALDAQKQVPMLSALGRAARELTR